MTEAERAFFQRSIRSHKKCLGTGRVGYNQHMVPIACTCIRRTMARIMLRRAEAFAGLRLGYPYSLGKYVGLKEDKVLGTGVFHAFQSHIVDPGLNECADQYVSVEDKSRVAELVKEHDGLGE